MTVPGDADTPDRHDDEAQLAAHASALADAVVDALPAWVEGAVVRRMLDWRGEVPPAVAARAAEAGRQARDDLAPRLRQLLATDVDRQRSTPLSLVRRAIPYANAVLAEAGVPEVVRDEAAERALPDDVFDLAPMTLGDVRPDLTEPGIAWGAAKAHVVLARRRAEGRR